MSVAAGASCLRGVVFGEIRGDRRVAAFRAIAGWPSFFVDSLRAVDLGLQPQGPTLLVVLHLDEALFGPSEQAQLSSLVAAGGGTEPDAGALEAHRQALRACRNRRLELSGEQLLPALVDLLEEGDRAATGPSIDDLLTIVDAPPPPPPTTAAPPPAAGVAPAAPEAEPSTRLGPYELISPLGHGGKGEVFLARAVEGKLKGRFVAPKRLNARGASDPAAVSRIGAESQTLALINSGAVVRLLDSGTCSQGRPWLAMEVLDAGDLGQLVRRCRARKSMLPLPVVGAVLKTLLDGIAAVHAATSRVGTRLNLVHCDVSPHNLFVSRTGVLRLGDFGSVRTAGERVQVALSEGRPSYLSPEALDGDVSVQRDLWAAAVTAWELLTLELPFSGESLEQLAAAIRACAPKKLRQLRPDAPPGLEAVLQRAFSKDPQKRYQSAVELAHALAPHFSPSPGTAEALVELLRGGEAATGTSAGASPRR